MDTILGRSYQGIQSPRELTPLAHPAHDYQVCICGGGNAGHTFAVFAATQGYRVNILTLRGDKHRIWAEANKRNGTRADFADGHTLVGHFNVVTNDPALAIPGTDIFILSVPAFAHETYLRHINEHADRPAIISVWPGAGGIEFQFLRIFGDRAEDFALVSSITLPWACRISDVGVAVDVMGIKHELGYMKFISKKFAQFEKFSPPNRTPVQILQHILIQDPVLRDHGHICGSSIAQPGPVAHGALMYGFWEMEWDGQPLDEKPLFYHGMSEQTAQLMDEVSRETIAIADALKLRRPDMEFVIEHIEAILLEYYGAECTDRSSLRGLMTTNPGYTGLTHPCVETEDGKFMPDFHYRYLKEDVPFGLVVFKGMALLVDVATPKIDMILSWAQERLGKEFLVDGQLTGKDMAESRAPQAFGFTSLDELF